MNFLQKELPKEAEQNLNGLLNPSYLKSFFEIACLSSSLSNLKFRL
ncbi:hypothetical protein BACSTE_02030 [Bacteroides stercoris ATCC 43183]|uniref:Uncharacterized protein n=1 Tax=Bacteroides stercoris ATCC 43183 TaxID=449673 RepID=B0NQ13_BACSE|nr:hypothetical protein BACSTE_02030 [Bacteroides stercoris ATCC 43183]